MTSRILLRQQLMREQMHEQERREQQQKFMQQRVPVSQTPAINVSVPTTLPAAAQVPMEVLKVRGRRAGGRARPLQNLFRFQVSYFSDRVCGRPDLSEPYLSPLIPPRLCFVKDGCQLAVDFCHPRCVGEGC